MSKHFIEVWQSDKEQREIHHFLHEGNNSYLFGYNPKYIGKKAYKRILAIVNTEVMAFNAMHKEPEKIESIHCEDCLAYYPKGRVHVCPPWLKELVAMQKAKSKIFPPLGKPKNGKNKRQNKRS